MKIKTDVAIDGNVQFEDYGSGSKTGTATKLLAVDSSGNVIEEGLGLIDSGFTMSQVTIEDDELLIYNDSTSRWESMDVIDFVRDIPRDASNNTTINLDNPLGTFYTTSASSSTSYITSNANHAGGWALTLINASSQPSVVGATLIPGATFIASTDMHMITFYDGASVKYYFLSLS